MKSPIGYHPLPSPFLKGGPRGFFFLVLFLFFSTAHATDFTTLAREHRDTLSLSTYVTVETCHKMATEVQTQADSLRALEANGIAKIYFETARGGPALPREELQILRDFYTAHGYAVAAGLATHPSTPGFGVRADRSLAWFNYQAPETAAAIESNVRDTAAVFDEIILDDFFCTGDESEQSLRARGARDWGAYRRDLLMAFAQRHVLGPARAINPKVSLIIKFPQWYDLFDVYGYDPERAPQLFDRVFVGTEARGPHTKRFGFTQPTEGFNNYRWLAACSGSKIGGAWFDFVDSTPEEYVSHAWMSVLAGARELVLFSFPSLLANDAGLAALQRDFPALVQLAEAVAAHPAVGIAAYKAPNATAGNDIYLLDHLGMLGLPLVPVATFPADAPVTLLPTQAAGDPALLKKITAAAKPGKTFVFTPGLLAAAPDGEALSRMAGVAWPKPLAPQTAAQVRTPDGDVEVPRGLDLGTALKPTTARVVLTAMVDGAPVPLLTELEKDYCRYLVLNLRGYGPEDFLATGEVLLSPRELGVLDLPQPVVDTLRQSLAGTFTRGAQLPARTMLHCLGEAGWLVKNYGAAPATLRVDDSVFGGKPLSKIPRIKTKTDNKDTYSLAIPTNDYVWIVGKKP